MSAVEAMAIGLPVVAFGVGGSGEYLLPSQTGVLAWQMNPRGLSDAIIELIQNRNKMGRLGILRF